VPQENGTVSGFAARALGRGAKPTEQGRRDLLDRGKPPKPALWNDARVRPLRLDPVPVALCVPADLAAELSHGLAWRSAEPEEGTKLKGVLVEQQPEDAAARLILEVAIDRDLLGLATPVGALQLDRAPDPLVPTCSSTTLPSGFVHVITSVSAIRANTVHGAANRR
jgi:hypothetical protein